MKQDNRHKDGISLRTIHVLMIIGAVILCGLMLYSTFHLAADFRHLTKVSEQQIELRKAARELMDASDYLTVRAQRFTVSGDRKFLDEYFKEAFEANHREEAIEKMAQCHDRKALKDLQDAMNASVKLMDREYYAMKLVIEARGYTDYPEVLRSVALSAKDKALSPEEKMRRATEMVLDDDYYKQKDNITASMRASLDELEKMAYESDASALKELGKEMNLMRVVIALMTLGIFFMVWLTSRLGIHPVLNAVDRIKDDSPIPEVGANEFRYLARAYNKMYEMYRTSLEHLNFKASHDELTGAYNRAGYDLLLSTIDFGSTYMMLFDVDNFKGINDTYGHETGDRVLVKLVQNLKNNFRSEDHICRIGGDEFVVFMVHSAENQAENQHDLIASKIDAVNQALRDTSDGLPETSISVGICHGSEAEDAEDLYRKADSAMYRAKQGGKQTYSFAIR